MILDDLAAYARERVGEAEKTTPLDVLRAQAEALEPAHHAFYHMLRDDPELSFICELKKASPSKGVISEKFPYRSILHEYMRGGANTISCLTEPKWFMGSNEIFEDVRANTTLPLLRKDFTVSEYQIYEAHLMQADAVLLIAALLNTDTLSRYLKLCDELGLDALVETHDEAEIESALAAGARIIGVNNRNLTDFTVDFSNAERLRNLIPSSVLYVAESGVKTPEDVGAVARIGAGGVLMGEALMRADNIVAFLQACRTAADDAYEAY